MSAKRRKSKRQRRTQFFGALVMLAALVLAYFFPELFADSAKDYSAAASLSSGDELHFIDVGQGDSSLILSGGEAVLIDGGPGSATESLIAYLEETGVEQLRAVIATHPHEDHIGGLAEVLNRFPTEEVFMPDCEATSTCFERMLDAIEAQDIPVTIPAPGDTLSFGNDAALAFLSPSPDADYTDVNNYSLVTRLTLGNTCVLYMGDAEALVEGELLDSGFDLSCDIIKIGHHGSSTSSTEEFLRETGAALGIISCARENSYGHPHQETLDTLAKLGIEARFTYDGTIVLAAGLEDAA